MKKTAQQRTREAAQQAEIDRLIVCLKKANDNAEKFEREWYLRGDEIDRLREALETVWFHHLDSINDWLPHVRAALNHTQGAEG